MAVVNYNALIDGAPDAIWNTLKAFGQIANWHPAISESWTEDNQPEGLPGTTRRLTLHDGAVLRETLLSIDDRQLQLSYSFAESVLPVDNYVAVIKLIPLSDVSQVLIQWTATFDARESDPDGTMSATIRELIVSGHINLQRHLQSLQSGQDQRS